MYVRIFTIFAAVLVLAACSTTDEDAAGMAGADREGISSGPLDEIYQGQAAGLEQGPAPGTQADLVGNVGDRVFFATDSYDLGSEARLTLESQAAWLAQHQSLTITVEGHADERGTREYNLALGERRANAVRNYLTALGVNAGRVNVVSYGKERPAVPGANDTAWSQNRRGVTKIN